ncbi:MAG: hypothetical protein LAT50_14730, partial [Ectothiorhodospiraceae bacterium]|nr:hypothetical protein [Ectothiorhodospiraceae bacterium]
TDAAAHMTNPPMANARVDSACLKATVYDAPAGGQTGALRKNWNDGQTASILPICGQQEKE